MNSPVDEFIEQFILESRELVEQTVAALTLLEQSPTDKERIDEIFRAFHTLKGSAGIVEFAAMERAVHALENELSEARLGARPVTQTLIDHGLACLDQVSRWLNAMERSGAIPDDVEAQASAFLAQLASATSTAATHTSAAINTAEAWLKSALARDPATAALARIAVQFTPAGDSFFTGEDPLAFIASLPGLLSIDITPIGAWPPLAALDPFACISVFTVLSNASLQQVTDYLGGHINTCEVVVLDDASPGAQQLQPSARSLLESQLLLIANCSSENFVGRLASAGKVASNVLRHGGHDTLADSVAQATETSLREHTAEALREQLAAMLTPQAAVATPVYEAAAVVSSEALPRTLRIETERIDALVRLTGELTVVKNSIGHGVNRKWSDVTAELASLKQQQGVLDRLVGELQKAVLQMRVLPLRTVLQRFPRVIRDLSRSMGKPATLIIEGDHTEADKAIVEMLFEPLLHVVRNALDHGVESAAVRKQHGKPALATIRMRAARQGEHVIIKISDDGGGIDAKKIRRIAGERNLLATEALNQMTDEQTIDLVFAPGFSTAAEVTELSGRGVGMDAVRSAVERIGGRVAIESELHQGTTATFTLPFSVMMTDVMSVEAGGQMFGIPLDAIVETLSVAVENISLVGNARVLVHRNRTIPIFDLPTILHIEQPQLDRREAIIVIVTIAGQLGGIQVDRLGERLVVMLKPLDGLLAGTPGIAGTTIVGDGRVLLILDLAGVL